MIGNRVAMGLLLLGFLTAIPLVCGVMYFFVWGPIFDTIYAAAGHHYADCNPYMQAPAPRACPDGVQPDWQKPPLAQMTTSIMGMGMLITFAIVGPGLMANAEEMDERKVKPILWT